MCIAWDRKRDKGRACGNEGWRDLGANCEVKVCILLENRFIRKEKGLLGWGVEDLIV